MAPRRIAIAVISVPCVKEVGGCGAEVEQPCFDSTWPPEAVKRRPRYHKCRTEMARRVGLEYVDTLEEIDALPQGAAPVA